MNTARRQTRMARWRLSQWANRQRLYHAINIVLAPPVQQPWPSPEAIRTAKVMFIIEGGIGDVVLATSVISAFVVTHRPHAVCLGVSNRAIDMTRVLWPNATVLAVDAGHEYRAATRQALRTHLVVGLRVSPRTAWLIRRTRAQVIAWRSWRPAPRSVHETDLMGAIAHVVPIPVVLGTEPPGAEPDLVVIKPGSQDLRQWPIPRWAAVTRILQANGYRVVLVGNRGERPICEQIMHKARVPNVVNLAGCTDETRLLGWLSRAALVLGSDSGVMHLAAGLGRPTVTLFGPVNPQQFGPRGNGLHLTVYSRRPCSPCQQSFCAFGEQPQCMVDIDVPDVLAAIARALDMPSLPQELVDL
jgi:hypothetical protein